MPHSNAPLSVEGRRRLTARCRHRPIAHVAAEMGISRQCASKWVGRYRRYGETVHRAKGQDFQAVLAVAFSSGDTADNAGARERRELRIRQHLVAASRARDYLWWAVADDTQDRSACSGS